MYKTTTLDTRTLVVRSNVESELTELIAYINQKVRTNKQELATRFLSFATDNYATNKTFSFNRNECYER